MIPAIFLVGKHTEHHSYTAKDKTEGKSRMGNPKYVRQDFLLHDRSKELFNLQIGWDYCMMNYI